MGIESKSMKFTNLLEKYGRVSVNRMHSSDRLFYPHYQVGVMGVDFGWVQFSESSLCALRGMCTQIRNVMYEEVYQIEHE